MIRSLSMLFALALLGCSGGGKESGTTTPTGAVTGTAVGSTSTGTPATGAATGTGTGATTGTGTGATTGTGTGAATGTGTGASSGTGTGTGTGTGAATGTGTGTGGPMPVNPCAPIVPANATVITTTAPHNTSGTYLVCDHETLSLTADNSTVYVMNQGDVVLNGINNTITVEAQVNWTYFMSPNHYVHDGSQGNVAPPNTEQICNPVTLDLSAFPVPPC